jgi:raffinose/stachyose/melibiose transport system substrate-binding protein
MASNSPTPASGKAVTLTLSTWRPEDTKQIQTLLNNFKSYAVVHGQNISVEYRPVMSVNYDSVMDIQLSRGEGPDLFYVRPYSVDGSISKFLMPLNDLAIDRSFESTKSVPWKGKDGTFYAEPFVGVVQGVYYNKDFFEKNNIPVPTNWDEFLKTLKAIQAADANMVPIANALNKNEDSEMFMSIAANFLGGPTGREQLMKTDGTAMCYNNLRVVSAFQAIEDLKPYLPKDAATMTSQTSKEMFFQRKAAMLFGGSWDLQKITDKATFAWDVFAVPAPSYRDTFVIFQPDIGVGINRATAHPKEAKMFLEWLMTQSAVQLTAENLPGFYPLNHMEVSHGSNPNDTKFLKLANNYVTDIRWTYTEINNEQPGAASIVRRDLNQMMTNSLTPLQAAQNLQNGLGEWYEPAQTCK